MGQKLHKKRVARELAINKIESIVGQKLISLYKGYNWYVDCKPEHGVVEIKNLTLHGDYGFVLYLKDLVNDLNLDLVMRAGGELLERCGLPTTHRPEDYKGIVKKDLRSNVIGDTHGAN